MSLQDGRDPGVLDTMFKNARMHLMWSLHHVSWPSRPPLVMIPHCITNTMLTDNTAPYLKVSTNSGTKIAYQDELIIS